MNNKLVIAVAIAIALAAGVLAGFLMQGPSPSGADAAGALIEKMAPEAAMLMGFAELSPVETEFEDWVYPEAESRRSGSSMSGSVNGKKFEFLRNAEFATKDDFETVTKHYSDKLAAILPGEEELDWQLSPNGSGSAGFNGVMVTSAMRQASNKRPVEVGNVSLQAKNCSISINISRGKDEDTTFVYVVFSKWLIEEE